MADIYEQHTAAFNQVAAYVILDKGESVARIAFKFPKDGAGRLYCYAHWFGKSMVRGYAGGYGYDKKTAAASSASGNMGTCVPSERDNAFKFALGKNSGYGWDRELEKAGFTVLQAL